MPAEPTCGFVVLSRCCWVELVGLLAILCDDRIRFVIRVRLRAIGKRADESSSSVPWLACFLERRLGLTGYSLVATGPVVADFEVSTTVASSTFLRPVPLRLIVSRRSARSLLKDCDRNMKTNFHHDRIIQNTCPT